MNVAFNRALTQKAIQRVFVIWFYCSVWCGCPSLQAFAHINFAGLEKSVSLFTKALLRFRKGICNVVMMCDLARFDKTTWASLLTHCVRYKLFGLTLTLLKNQHFRLSPTVLVSCACNCSLQNYFGFRRSPCMFVCCFFVASRPRAAVQDVAR